MGHTNTPDKIQYRSAVVLLTCIFTLTVGCSSNDAEDISICNSAIEIEDLVLDPLSIEAARSLLVGSWETPATETADCMQLVNFHCDFTFDNAALDERQTGTWDVRSVDELEEAVLLEVDTLTDNGMMNCDAISEPDIVVFQVFLSYPDQNTMRWFSDQGAVVFTRTTQTQ